MNIKRSSFIQSFLIYFMIVLISLSLSGCKYIPGIPPTDTPNAPSGMVNIIVRDMRSYDIFMDGTSSENRLGQTDGMGRGTFYNIPIGRHTFYAITGAGWAYINYHAEQEIFIGDNTVEIRPPWY